MCFTINIMLSRDAIEDRFGVNASVLHDFEYRYFVKAFENPLIPVVSQHEPGEVQLMRWGLIPYWSRDRKQAIDIRKGTYNARAETLHMKPSFKRPFMESRCWILSRGFFEWQHVSGSRKIPWYISRKDGNIFAFAGIYDIWHDHESDQIETTCSLITVSANPMMEKIHNTKKRMPLILNRNNERGWLKNDFKLDEGKKMLRPYGEQEFTACKVNLGPGSDPHDRSVIEEYKPPIEDGLF